MAARKTPTARKWSRTTSGTYMIAARISLRLRDRLRSYVDESGLTITDVVIFALSDYLTQKGK